MNALDNANIKDEPRKGPESFAFPEAKSSKTGVSVSYAPHPDRRWHVLRITYGKAQEAADDIIEQGRYAYLPKVWRHTRCRTTGKRRRRLVPFMNLIFAYTTPREAEWLVSASRESRYITFYYDHFAQKPDGKNPPLTVSLKDMVPLVRATAPMDEHVMQVDIARCRFISNDIVRVTEGPFEGITGRVARVARQNRVVIHIPGLKSGLTTAYIPPHCLEKVEGE